MRKLILLVSAILVVVFVIMPFAFNNLTKRFVNQIFDGRTAEATHSNAVHEASLSLAAVKQPNAAVVLSRETLAPLLEQATRTAIERSGFNAKNVRAVFGEQRIKVSAEVSGEFKKNPDIIFTGTVFGSTAISTVKGQIKLVPTLDSVTLNSLDGAAYRLPRPMSQALGVFLDAALGTISKSIQPILFDTPAVLVDTEKPQFGSGGAPIPRILLDGSAVLIEESRLSWLGTLRPQNEAEVNQGLDVTDGSSATKDYQQYRKSFRGIGGPLLAGLGDEGVALAPSLLAGIFGSLYTVGSPESRATAALEAALQAATSMAGPDLSMSVPIETIKSIIEPRLLTIVQREAEKAGISVSEATVQTRYGASVLQAIGEAELSYPSPVAVKFQIAVSVAPVAQGAKLVLQPGLDEVVLLSAESDSLDTAAFTSAINRLIGNLAAGLDAALPPIPIVIEPIGVDAIRLEPEESGATSMSFAPTEIPAMEIRVDRIAALLTPNGLEILADVETDSESQPARVVREANNDVPSDPAAIEKIFAELSMLPRSGNSASSGQLRAVVTWRRVAELINAEWTDLGGIRGRLEFDTGRESLDTTEIELVERPNYECNRNRECTFNSCAKDCIRDNCDYGCPSVGSHLPCPTLTEPLRFCYQSVEEPGCAAGREVCKLGREAKYSACVLGCNTKASLEQVDCDWLAEMEVAGCQLGAAIQNVGSEIGGVGAIGGDIRAKGAAEIDGAILSLSTELPGLRFVPEFSGRISIDGSIHFTPYDIIGNLLTCPAGKMPFSSTVTIPRQRPSIVAGLAEDLEPDDSDGVVDLDLVATIEPFTIRLKVDPPPVNMIFDQNPHLTIICNPIIGAAIAGLRILGGVSALAGPDLIRAAAGTETAAVLTGDIRMDVDKTEFPISIEHTSVQIGDDRFVLEPKLLKTAILLEAKRVAE